MPLTEKGEEIKHNMEKQYGPEKAERVFYASKNAGTISGVDSVPVGDCYRRDAAEGEEFHLAQHQHHSELSKQHYASGNSEQGMHHYLEAGTHFHKANEPGRDQSWPPMDPTSIGAMPTMERGADAPEQPHNYGRTIGFGPSARPEFPHPESPEGRARAAKGEGHQYTLPLKPSDAEPLNSESMRAVRKTEIEPGRGQERLQFKSHEARNPVEERRRERERAGPTGPEVLHNKDAAPQPGEPGHEARELAVAHELEAMHNPASTFEDALFGGGRGHDYSRDATGLPQTVTHRQMQNFAAALNFGEGVTK